MRSSFVVLAVVSVIGLAKAAPAPQGSTAALPTDGSTTTTDNNSGDWSDFGTQGESLIDPTDVQDSILTSLAADNSTSGSDTDGAASAETTQTPTAESIANARNTFGGGDDDDSGDEGFSTALPTAAIATRRA